MKFDLTDMTGMAADLSELVPDIEDKAEFRTYDKDFGLAPEPRPSGEFKPVWWDEDLPAPMKDAINEGYLFRTPSNIDIDSTGEETNWRFAFHRDAVKTHESIQMEGLPIPFIIIKFMSYWTVWLPDGYSALFIEPTGRRRALFTPFNGVIDFDNFPTITHAPSLLEKAVKNKRIEAGTPTFQMIPFKREDMLKTATIREATQDELDEMNNSDYERADREPTETTVEVDSITESNLK